MSTSQVEFKIDTDGQALMRVKETGTVMLYFAHMPMTAVRDASSYYDGTGRKYATGTVYYDGEVKWAAWPFTSTRFSRETYPARGTETRPSDWIVAFDRWISGRLYHFVKVTDGATGKREVKVFEGRTTTVLKHFVYGQ